MPDFVGIGGVQMKAPEMAAQANDVKEPKKAGTPALPEVLANARPSRASIVCRVLIGIVTLSISEIVRHVRASRLAAPRNVQPGLSSRQSAAVNRANAPLLAALNSSQNAMPKPIAKAIQEANESVIKRFGNDADALHGRSISQSKAGLELTKILKEAIQKGDHAIKAPEVKAKFEMIAALHFLGDDLNQYCLDKTKELKMPSEFQGSSLALGLMRNSSVVTNLLRGVESPEQVNDVKAQIKAMLNKEMEQRKVLSNHYEKLKSAAVAKLAEAAGCSEETASKQFVKFIGNKCAGMIADARRSPDTGHVCDIASLATTIEAHINKEVQSRLDTMTIVNKFFAAPETRSALRLSALDSKLRPESVVLAKKVADQLDIKALGLVSSVDEPFAPDIADALETMLREERKLVTELAGQMGLDFNGEEDWAAIGGAITFALFDKEPNLAKQMTTNKDVLALAASSLCEVFQPKPGQKTEDRQINSLLLTMLHHPKIDVYTRQFEVSEQRKLAEGLQNGPRPEDLVNDVRQHADALRVRFGDKVPADPLKSSEWSVTESDAVMRLWSGKPVEKKELVLAYEKLVKQNVVLKGVKEFAEETAKALGVAYAQLSLEGLANSPALSGQLDRVTRPEQMSGFVESVKSFVKSEIEMQKEVLAQSSEIVNESIKTLAQRTGMAEADVRKLCGPKLEGKMKSKFTSLMDGAQRDPATGAILPETKAAFESELRKVSETFVNGRLTVLAAIDEAHVSGNAREAMLHGAIEGKGFTSPDAVKIVVETAQSMNPATILEKLDQEPRIFLDAVESLMNQGFELLKDQIGLRTSDLEPDDQQPLFNVVIEQLLDKESRIAEAFSSRRDSLNQLVAMSSTIALNAEKSNSTTTQLVLDFLMAAANR